MDRRDFLIGAGLAGAAAASPAIAGQAEPSKTAKQIWGPRVELEGLPELFKPQEVPSFTVVPAGIDNLGLHSVDVFQIPQFDNGLFEVDFNGYFRVARAESTSPDWNKMSIRVNIIDLAMNGTHPQLGNIRVRLNPAVLSTGQIFPPDTTAAAGNKQDPQDGACRIATAVTFEIEEIGLRLFNAEPILLMNNHVRSIPPVDDPSGQALLYRLPLFDMDDPNGNAMAYLTSLKYGADHYLTPDEVAAIKAA